MYIQHIKNIGPRLYLSICITYCFRHEGIAALFKLVQMTLLPVCLCCHWKKTSDRFLVCLGGFLEVRDENTSGYVRPVHHVKSLTQHH
jgi:hypothetical protein